MALSHCPPSECAPTVRVSAQSFRIYTGSTAVSDFEIGFSVTGRDLSIPLALAIRVEPAPTGLNDLTKFLQALEK
jgi:hypothetical protein